MPRAVRYCWVFCTPRRKLTSRGTAQNSLTVSGTQSVFLELNKDLAFKLRKQRPRTGLVPGGCSVEFEQLLPQREEESMCLALWWWSQL